MVKKIVVIIVAVITCFPLMQNCDTTEPSNDDHPDTTTQNFSFETFEFGDGYESSYFNDVWIFDENNIWAVGYLGTDEVTNANIMRWNGNNWATFGRNFNSAGINGIWALDSTNIFFASGIVLQYNKGVFQWMNFDNVPLTNGQGVHKLWGSSENNIWGVGPAGTIVHYNGNEWKKIDFDTQWNFHDITGSESSGSCYTVGRNMSFTNIILELKQNSVEVIFNSDSSDFPYSFTVLKMLNSNEFYVAGTQIGKFFLNSRKLERVTDFTEGYAIPTAAISSSNDIYFFGTYYNNGNVIKRMIHYNGTRYKEFDLPHRETIIYGESMAIKNLAIEVEFSENKAYLLKVIRN